MFYKKMFLLCLLLVVVSNIESFAPFSSEHVNSEHAIYIGVLQINHISNDSVANLSIKVFQNDLEDALRNVGDLKKIESNTDFCFLHQEAISAYFQQHVQCNINQQEMNLTFKRGKSINEVYQFFFEINCPPTWKTFDIKADFLMELFPAQSNIIQLQDGDNKRFGRLNKESKRLQFAL